MFWLKQSTSVVIPFGPFVDKTDGVTLLANATTITDIDHGTTGIFLSKNGGDSIIRHAVVTASVADDYGMMRVTLDATDTNTLGTLRMSYAKAATYVPVWQDFMIVPANVWDSFFGADYLQVDDTQILGTAISTPATAGILDVNVKNIANAAVSTTTAQIGVNAVQISGDSVAADNCEAMFDGTGYSGGSIKLDVNSVQISGDSVAADNCELMFDGTGYAGGSLKLDVNSTQISGSVTAADNCQLMFDGTGYTGGAIPLCVDSVYVSGSSTAADNLELISLNAKGTDNKLLISTNTQDLSTTLSVEAKTFGSTLDLTTTMKNSIFNYVVENSKSFLSMIRLMYAVLCGKSSGGGTTSVNFRDDADTKNRVAATVDLDGNRTAITKDAS